MGEGVREVMTTLTAASLNMTMVEKEILTVLIKKSPRRIKVLD